MHLPDRVQELVRRLPSRPDLGAAVGDLGPSSCITSLAGPSGPLGRKMLAFREYVAFTAAEVGVAVRRVQNVWGRVRATSCWCFTACHFSLESRSQPVSQLVLRGPGPRQTQGILCTPATILAAQCSGCRLLKADGGSVQVLTTKPACTPVTRPSTSDPRLPSRA